MSVFRSGAWQIARACEQIRADKRLSGGYHAVGHSQGGLLMRGLVQRCRDPPAKTLISIGGPQLGVRSCKGICPLLPQPYLDDFMYSK